MKQKISLLVVYTFTVVCGVLLFQNCSSPKFEHVPTEMSATNQQGATSTQTTAPSTSSHQRYLCLVKFNGYAAGQGTIFTVYNTSSNTDCVNMAQNNFVNNGRTKTIIAYYVALTDFDPQATATSSFQDSLNNQGFTNATAETFIRGRFTPVRTFQAGT